MTKSVHVLLSGLQVAKISNVNQEIDETFVQSIRTMLKQALRQLPHLSQSGKASGFPIVTLLDEVKTIHPSSDNNDYRILFSIEEDIKFERCDLYALSNYLNAYMLRHPISE